MGKAGKLLILGLWLLPITVLAASLGDLLIDLRYRTGETITSESSYADSVAVGWINMSQSRIVLLGGYLPKFTDLLYASEDTITLPTDFRSITQVKVLSNGRWFSDTLMKFDVDWFDQDSATLVMAGGGFAERDYEVAYIADSNEYLLPLDFGFATAVMVQRSGEWFGALPNAGFLHDTSQLNYTIHQYDVDSAALYLNGIIPSIERQVDITYVADSNVYVLPLDFRRTKAVMVYRDTEWLGMIPNNSLASDTDAVSYTVHKHNTDSSSIYVNGIFTSIERRYDVIYSAGAHSYQLPVDYRQVKAVMVFTNYAWWGVIQNRGFMRDTSVANYTIHQHGVDSSTLYIKGRDLLSGDTIRVIYQSGLIAGDAIRVIYEGGLLPNDTIRVVYRGGLRANDTIRVEYLAAATSMGVDTSAICAVPTELHTFIVEEAVGYYYGYLRMFQQQALIWQWVRVDMGILKPEEK